MKRNAPYSVSEIRVSPFGALGHDSKPSLVKKPRIVAVRARNPVKSFIQDLGGRLDAESISVDAEERSMSFEKFTTARLLEIKS